MAVRYTVDDWYWQVAGDTQVWSSARFAYVGNSDSQYLAWLAAGGTLTQIDSMDSLGAVMASQRIPSYLAGGLSVVSTGTPSLSATYSLDDTTLAQIGTLARDFACGLGFPAQAPTFSYPDVHGNMIMFAGLQMENLYKAIRDYVFNVGVAVQALVHKQPATLPSQPVTMP